MATKTWSGRAGGAVHRLLGPGVFSPTTTSRTLAEALEIEPGDTVIDVGCGSGVLSFVAARLGAKRVIGVDLSEEAVEVARENAAGWVSRTMCEFRGGNLLDPVRDVQADVLIGDVSGIPDAIAQESGWFDDGRAGGPTGAELPRHARSIGDTLAMGGRLVPPDGHDPARAGHPRRRARDLRRPHAARARTRVPAPGLVGRSKAVARMMKEGSVSFRQRGSRWLWQLRIWRCDRV